MVLGVGVLFATRPNLSSNVVAGVLTTLGIAVIVIGVTSAARGERFIEEHPAEHAEEQAEHDAEGDEPTGNTPLTPDGTKSVTTTTVAEGEG